MRLLRRLSKEGQAALLQAFDHHDKKEPSIEWIAADAFRIWSMDGGDITCREFVIKEVKK